MPRSYCESWSQRGPAPNHCSSRFRTPSRTSRDCPSAFRLFTAGTDSLHSLLRRLPPSGCRRIAGPKSLILNSTSWRISHRRLADDSLGNRRRRNRNARHHRRPRRLTTSPGSFRPGPGRIRPGELMARPGEESARGAFGPARGRAARGFTAINACARSLWTLQTPPRTFAPRCLATAPSSYV